MGSGRVVVVAAGALLGVAEGVGVLPGAATVLVGTEVLEGAEETVATARSNAIGELAKAGGSSSATISIVTAGDWRAAAVGASVDEHDATNPATSVTPFVLTIYLA